MTRTSIIDDAREVVRASALIELGARMQVLESELALPRDRLIRLYHEIKGESPPKGMLPSSADWYMTWQANIHASLFYNAYVFLKDQAGCSHLDALTKGFRLYREHCAQNRLEMQLDLTRAWTLVRFFKGGLLQLTACRRCAGKFVIHKYDAPDGKVCAICQPPSRAGKRAKDKEVPAASCGTDGASDDAETQTEIDAQGEARSEKPPRPKPIPRD
ncbi:flagellar transcriptional regulator FlhC [Paraburkholderia oxyphila]|uniref:flagellar transcriptional regulator FlhC n=1 Tax=Paraburkholderia oxyphila TaxID=614212 RepID=UPI0009FC3526|nr:flagellar transcriptional regulator FlhC [Paraburkholderia oxyphila]